MERKSSTIGVILVLIGVALLIIAISPSARTNILLNESQTIQGGYYYYVMYDFDDAPAMHMKFTVSKGYIIDFWVMDETDFNSFKSGRTFEYYSYTSRERTSSAEIDWTPPDNQKTYFVWDNPSSSSRIVSMFFSSGGGGYLPDWAKVAVGGCGFSLLICGLLQFRTTTSTKMQMTWKRPDGIVGIAVFWTISSLVTIYLATNSVISGLGVLPYLSDPTMHEWFRFAVPAEIVLNLFGLAFGFLTLVVVYGLWTARSWSYHFALACPIFLIILNFAFLRLNASTPVEVLETLNGNANQVFSAYFTVPILVWNLVWIVGTWIYIRQPHVKQYLNQIPTPSSTQRPVILPPPPSLIATPEERKFCRYCGEENETDAVFCEKCGKKIG